MANFWTTWTRSDNVIRPAQPSTIELKTMSDPMTANHHESNRTFYDRISSYYDLIADAGEHKAREAGEQILNPRPSEHILEIGFGTGNSIVSLAKHVQPSGTISGIDISEGMLNVASKKAAQNDLADRIELKVGDARELPFEADSFDAVFTSFTLELFPLTDIAMVLKEIERVLKPGGRLVIVSMSAVKEGDHASLLEKTYIWMHRHFPHLVDCQPIDVEKHLAETELKSVQFQEVKIWTMPVAIVSATKRIS